MRALLFAGCAALSVGVDDSGWPLSATRAGDERDSVVDDRPGALQFGVRAGDLLGSPSSVTASVLDDSTTSLVQVEAEGMAGAATKLLTTALEALKDKQAMGDGDMATKVTEVQAAVAKEIEKLAVVCTSDIDAAVTKKAGELERTHTQAMADAADKAREDLEEQLGQTVPKTEHEEMIRTKDSEKQEIAQQLTESQGTVNQLRAVIKATLTKLGVTTTNTTVTTTNTTVASQATTSGKHVKLKAAKVECECFDLEGNLNVDDTVMNEEGLKSQVLLKTNDCTKALNALHIPKKNKPTGTGATRDARAKNAREKLRRKLCDGDYD